MQIAPQPAFNQSGLALHATAGKITFAGKMHIAAGANASTEATSDFIIAQVNVRAARRTDCRRRGTRNLLFAFTLETLDDGTGLPLPKILEFAKDRCGGLRRSRFFGRPQLQARFRCERSKRAAALAADRTLGRRVFHLLEAAVRTFRTDFCRRWIGHCMLAEAFLLRSHSECRLYRLAGPHNFRARRSLCRNGSGGDFRFPDKGCPFFNHKTRCFEIALQHAFGFEFAALGNGDIAVNLAVNGDRFGFDLTPNLSVFTDCQNAIRVDVAFDFAVDEQFFLELDRAFDFDIAREDVFASVFCHRIRFWIWIIDYGWFWWCLFAARKMLVSIWNRIPRFFSNRGRRLLRDESFEHLVVM